VWDPDTLQTLAVLKGFHRRAITSLRFSRNGKLLASVGHDRFHSLAIYDWEGMNLVAHTRTVESKTLAVSFMPENAGLIQCGVRFIRSVHWVAPTNGVQYTRIAETRADA
jgi:microtubule-associated protein-like 6